MDVNNFNPWWQNEKAPFTFLVEKREIFNEIIEYIDKRQIVLITGLRRIAKTTLMYQIINELIKVDVRPYNIYIFHLIRWNMAWRILSNSMRLKCCVEISLKGKPAYSLFILSTKWSLVINQKSNRF